MGIKDAFARLFGAEEPDQRAIEHQAEDFISREYQAFLQEGYPEEEKGFTLWFKKACKFSYNLLKLKAPPNMANTLNQHLLVTELDVTPDQVFSLTVLTAVIGLVVTMPLLLIGDVLG